MATKMFAAQTRSPSDKPIPYHALAAELFKGGKTQILVPFLGAGASISEVESKKEPELNEPGQAIIDSVSKQLSLTGSAKEFLEASIRVAWRIQQLEASGPTENPFDAVKRSVWPPSAAELAAALAYMAEYDRFTRPARWFGSRLPNGGPADLAIVLSRAAKVTGLASLAPPLMSVASYYSHNLDPKELWQQLRTLFENKTKPTKVHKMVACVASHHVGSHPTDYLIITTNYDCLVEKALELAKVPYCTMTVGKEDDRIVASFSDDLRQYLEMDQEDFDYFKEKIEVAPANCYPLPHRPIAIVYKIHGCLKCRTGQDSVILTDEDYVDYMRKNGPANSRIPNPVKQLVDRRAFLFMGYSFTDWNVRAWYKSIVEDVSMRGKHSHDWAVMNDVDPYEDGFFQKSDIFLLMEDLTRFAETIMKDAPPGASACGEWR